MSTSTDAKQYEESPPPYCESLQFDAIKLDPIKDEESSNMSMKALRSVLEWVEILTPSRHTSHDILKDLLVLLTWYFRLLSEVYGKSPEVLGNNRNPPPREPIQHCTRRLGDISRKNHIRTKKLSRLSPYSMLDLVIRCTFYEKGLTNTSKISSVLLKQMIIYTTYPCSTLGDFRIYPRQMPLFKLQPAYKPSEYAVRLPTTFVLRLVEKRRGERFFIESNNSEEFRGSRRWLGLRKWGRENLKQRARTYEQEAYDDATTKYRNDLREEHRGFTRSSIGSDLHQVHSEAMRTVI